MCFRYICLHLPFIFVLIFKSHSIVLIFPTCCHDDKNFHWFPASPDPVRVLPDMTRAVRFIPLSDATPERARWMWIWFVGQSPRISRQNGQNLSPNWQANFCCLKFSINWKLLWNTSTAKSYFEKSTYCSFVWDLILGKIHATNTSIQCI